MSDNMPNCGYLLPQLENGNSQAGGATGGLGLHDWGGLSFFDSGNNDWDPVNSTKISPPTADARRRLQNEIRAYDKEGDYGIYFVMDEKEVNLLHALVVGPDDTPYEGGFFYFLLRIPHDYPFRPPLVKLMTTGNGQIQFNPIFHYNGKVCISILGTSCGPAWTPNLTIRVLLLSIQSMLSEEPFLVEPGFGSIGSLTGTDHAEEIQELSRKGKNHVRFQTLRVAVLDMMTKNMDSRDMPTVLKEKMKEIFTAKLDYYTLAMMPKEGSSAVFQILKVRLDKMISENDAQRVNAETTEDEDNSG